MGTTQTSAKLDYQSSLSQEEWLARLDEEFRTVTITQAEAANADKVADTALEDFCRSAYLAYEVGKVGLEAMALTLGISKPTVTTYELIGRGVSLPVTDNCTKAIYTPKGVFLYYAESVKHLRATVNNALSRTVKADGKLVRVGYTVAEIRAIGGSVADRASFIAALNKRTPRHAALLDKKANDKEEERRASLTRSSVLAEVIEMLDGIEDLPSSDNDPLLIQSVIDTLMALS